jgi:hypothetical protein
MSWRSIVEGELYVFVLSLIAMGLFTSASNALIGWPTLTNATIATGALAIFIAANALVVYVKRNHEHLLVAYQADGGGVEQ